jgi:SAM-dependent methyltransferase
VRSNDQRLKKATGFAATEPSVEKPRDYYSHPRRELISLIPASAVRILEVGCAEGVFANSLRESRMPNCVEIVGVEMNPSAALKAEQCVDRVFVGSIENLELPFENYFDCVVFADVLEHLVDPWKTLEKIKGYLRPGGFVVASIPNVQHWRVILSLFRGEWEYTKEGTLDDTHLRFFTRKSIIDFFGTAEFAVREVRAHVPTPKGRQLNWMTARIVEAFLTFQYYVVAEHVPAIVDSKSSLVTDRLMTVQHQ